MSNYVSFFSQMYHFLAYSIKKPKMQLENGMFIISIDVDVGSRELGVINRGKMIEMLTSTLVNIGSERLRNWLFLCLLKRLITLGYQ